MPQVNQLMISNTEHPTSDYIPHKGKLLLKPGCVSSDLNVQVTYSIDGCVRNLHMAEAPADLEQPASSYRVGTCFANAQKGTYFDGTGFAKAGEVLPSPSC